MTGTTEPIRVCIVQPNPCSPSETFLRAHAEYLPGRVAVVAGPPSIDGRPIMPTGLAARAWRKAARLASGRTWFDDRTEAYLKVFRHHGTDVVLAEYGTTGVDVLEACRRAGIPLVVHFHGYDASEGRLLEDMADAYRRLFREAAGIIGVSRMMSERLIDLGAPADRVHWISCGVDCEVFAGAEPATAPPVFLAVGRFCEKKAPDLTLQAFARVHGAYPEARLRMIGGGPLLASCRGLAGELAIADAVSFLGVQTPDVVREELKRARCFVQHSVVASNGDMEGTPVAILEAGAAGLPAVSTRLGGILDAVVEGETGFLVDERDVPAMAERMLALAAERERAGRMGRAARAWIRAEYSMTRQIGKLWEVIRSCRADAVAPATSGSVGAPGHRAADPGLVTQS